MSDRYPLLEEVRAALDAEGLLLRGAFHPVPEDEAPLDAATLLMVGNAGPAMWRAYRASRKREQDPLNAWSGRVLSGIADRFGATPVFPFDGPPYMPFFAWAKRAETVSNSPIGMLIHPVFGLWHAWRGALAFRERLALPAPAEAVSPCDGCAAQPCLTTCPVDAFRQGHYDVAVCAGHLRTQEGADCMAEGCRARRSCPVGKGYVYDPDQARFHMDAFLKNQPS